MRKIRCIACHRELLQHTTTGVRVCPDCDCVALWPAWPKGTWTRAKVA